MTDPDVVLAAYLHPNTVSHSFSESLMRLVGHDLAHSGRLLRSGGPVVFRCGPGGIVEARNKVMAHFLDHSQADWLWLVDADMGFAPDTVDRLLAVADPEERPVVGALCFGLRETEPDGMQGWVTRPFPTLYDWGQDTAGHHGFAVRRSYPVNTVTRVAGTGAACLLVHRSVASQIRDQHGDVWFDRVRYGDGTPVAEDLSFCYRVNQAGFGVYVHTGVRTSHHKQVWVAEPDYWSSLRMPPADESVAVIVPVMGRPQNAEPFMRSLRASTGLATVYAIAGPEETAEATQDTERAWWDAGAQVISGSAVTFAEKVNVGYRLSSEPWLFVTGDDVTFHPGWLDHAQHVACSLDAAVVGTNDLGNPRVTTGEHATHLLIRRDYVDEQGASWDGPKVVCHEGYHHWWVDDEIVTAAKQRGQWAMALGSVVEHLHPAWGKADDDEVYELGRAHASADRDLFQSRVRRFLATNEG